jgi:hypothetical protein
VSVRDLKGDVAVGTPQVLRARNAREFRTLDAGDAVPVASREFSRTERLLIRFQAYGPGGEPPVVTAKLLSRGGTAMRELTVAQAATPGDHEIDLPLACGRRLHGRGQREAGRAARPIASASGSRRSSRMQVRL